jgi:NAD+ kinase
MTARVLLLANRTRPGVVERIEETRALIGRFGTLAAEEEIDHGLGDSPQPPTAGWDVALVLGGDGSLLCQARRLIDLGRPVVGVNFGRLGFLAEFDWDSFRQHAGMVFSERRLVRERMALAAEVASADGAVRFRSAAVNDVVVAAGPPYRMIELRIAATLGGDAQGPDLVGDGVIVATPIGSTAYNVSAGGPIVHPDVEAFVVTPNAAHSLAFRPIVMPATEALAIRVVRANEGTTLVVDGQATHPLREGDTVRVVRHGRRLRLVGNPSSSYWRTLLDKMRWAAPPTYRDRGP